MFGQPAGFEMVIWLLWACLIVASIVVTIRAMLALTKIPARLEAIEQAIREMGAARDGRVA